MLVLDENDFAIQKTEQLLSPIFADRISKSTIDKLATQIGAIKSIDEKITIPSIVPLSQVIADSLENAVEHAQAENSTKPITAWKSDWFKKDENGKFILKSHWTAGKTSRTKLKFMANIY